VDAELARGIGCGRDDAALISLSTDDDGFALERWIEELFDGDEEGVHVDVKVGLHFTASPLRSAQARCSGDMGGQR
jgi:hypothetical protein